jgi:hypothetical protein
MADLNDDELASEIARIREAVVNKRKADSLAIAAASEKRVRMLRELDEMNLELSATYSGSTNSSSGSSSSSASTNYSSSTSSASTNYSSLTDTSQTSKLSSSSNVPQAVVPEVLAAQARAAKNSMFAYWTVKDKTAIEIDQIDQRRIGDAKANSESKESELHRPRKVIPAKAASASKDSMRLCNPSTWNTLRSKLTGDDTKVVTYNAAEKRIWCSACPCFVRDDNLSPHILSGKHVAALKVAIEANRHQTSLENAISATSALNGTLSHKTHLFRCELVRTLLTCALSVNKADEIKHFLEKWTKIESTDSSNLLRTYLPIIKVCQSCNHEVNNEVR